MDFFNFLIASTVPIIILFKFMPDVVLYILQVIMI